MSTSEDEIQRFDDIKQMDSSEYLIHNETEEDVQNVDLHQEHLVQMIQSLLYLQSLNRTTDRPIQLAEPVRISAPSQSRLLLFDLEHTLVYSKEVIISPDDESADYDHFKVNVHRRPFVFECLQQLSEFYHIGIFTSSTQEYADGIIDQVLDPDRTLIKSRLYRQHCYQTSDGIYIKDLSVITSHNLSQILLVDNNVYSFGFQLSNGIPILPFQADPDDKELIYLTSYLLSLSKTQDMISANANTFKLEELIAQDLNGYLLSNMNQSMNPETLDQSFNYSNKISEIAEVDENTDDEQY